MGNHQPFIQTLKAEITFPDRTDINEYDRYWMKESEYNMENNNTLFPVVNPVDKRLIHGRNSNTDPNMRKLTRIILDIIDAYGFLPQSYISLEYKTKWYALKKNTERVEQDAVTERAFKMFRTIRGVTDFTPYRIRGRLAVKDKETGRVFK